MVNPATPVHPIDQETADFIQWSVSINVATRNASNRPAVARATGCSLSPDCQRLSIYLARTHNQTVLDNLQENRQLAVVISRPSTHKTIQFKGNDACIRPLLPDDQANIRAYIESFKQEIRGIGYPPAFCDAIMPPLDTDFVAIEFTPDRAYSQTPGPQAGKKLSP